MHAQLRIITLNHATINNFFTRHYMLCVLLCEPSRSTQREREWLDSCVKIFSLFTHSSSRDFRWNKMSVFKWITRSINQGRVPGETRWTLKMHLPITASAKASAINARWCVKLDGSATMLCNSTISLFSVLIFYDAMRERQRLARTDTCAIVARLDHNFSWLNHERESRVWDDDKLCALNVYVRAERKVKSEEDDDFSWGLRLLCARWKNIFTRKKTRVFSTSEGNSPTMNKII